MDNIPRFCANCGKELSTGAKFCVYCSTPVQLVGQTQPLYQPSFAQQFKRENSPPSRRVGILLGIGIFFIPYIFAWFTLRPGYSTQARAISLGWAGFIILMSFINIATNPGRPSNANSSSSTITSNVNTVNAAQANMQNAANALANAANTVASSANKTNAPKNSCADIESELASVESDQARVEEMLDATEDFGPQAGSPKRAIYMNALKRKGELQLRHVALEKKLRACGKRK